MWKNELFQVSLNQRQNDKCSLIELISVKEPTIPIVFKLILAETWHEESWLEKGDTVRVIGTFCRENSYQLTLDDHWSLHTGLSKAQMLVVEPDILV